MTSTDLLPHGYIDAHHHVWAPDSLGDDIGYGWLRDIGAPKPFGDPTPIQRDYLMAEFLAETDTAPRASIHVQTDGTLPDPVAETRFVQDQADRADHAVKIVALADLSADNLRETLARHAESRDFAGVRQIVARLDDRPELCFAPTDYLTNLTWQNGLKVLEGEGLTFDLQMYSEQAEAALEALSATPALTVIIDHALCPYDPTKFTLWSSALALMATRPNTYIKLSGWGMYDASWHVTGGMAVQPMVAEILERFGSDRVMWGSNFPVESLATRYGSCRDVHAELVPSASQEDIFLNSVSKAYGIKLK